MFGIIVLIVVNLAIGYALATVSVSAEPAADSMGLAPQQLDEQ